MKKLKQTSSGTMLDLWRPPKYSGDPVGCLTTTYTFSPGLFDEQCLARFMNIESEPDRESLAYLLERESRLGSIYAGVLVDYTQSGVEHSLRWDVLPVRNGNAKQHAKLSLLVWSQHIRLIVTSANLTEAGYRYNHEVTSAVESTSNESNETLLNDAIVFLRDLIRFVPGHSSILPEVQRAENFLNQIEKQIQSWETNNRREVIHQQLVFTIPENQEKVKKSSLEESIQFCRKRGGSPTKVKIASPFFDIEREQSTVTAALCKLMARSTRRNLCFCVPSVNSNNDDLPRLQAPKSLLLTPQNYNGMVTVEKLPEKDKDKNERPWHAKMLAFSSDHYSGLMIGSSNFTKAGMGMIDQCNIEANLVTLVDVKDYRREKGFLEAIWPDTESISNPEEAEWLGGRSEEEENELAVNVRLPSGFLSATYRAGDDRKIILRFNPGKLPKGWEIHAVGIKKELILSSKKWLDQGSPSDVSVRWEPLYPPEKLHIKWHNLEAFMPLNVENSNELPPPEKMTDMTADDLLWILAATDPGSAFRAWAKKQQPSEFFDSDLDSAIPIDLDPLRRHDLNHTFLHRIRYRARLFAQLRVNLERPVWSLHALEWRLRGLIGVEVLAERLLSDFEKAEQNVNECLLTLADFLIVLNEVNYISKKGTVSKEDYQKCYRLFLSDLSKNLNTKVKTKKRAISKDLFEFWNRVVKECRK